MAVPPPTNITTRTFISGITWYWKVPIRNEHNTITHDTTDDANHPTGSTKLTFQGQTTTGTMDRFTDAAGVQALLESLSNIAPGDVSVTGGPLNTDDIDVEFTGAYAGTNVVKISLTAATNEFATNVQVWGTPDTEQLQPSFDVHHFQAQLWEDEVEGAGTLLRTDEWIVGSEFTYPTTGYATDYLFRVRSVSPNGEFSEWAGASPANPDEGGVGPQGNQGNQGYQGNQAADTLIYYIKPLDGTAIKNGTGTLNIEAHKIQGGVDSALVSGTIKLRNEANADWGYSKAVSAADIDESQVVTLKDGVGGTPLDTITLVDIADGGVAGYIEPSASLSWTRASDQTTWTPSTSTVDLDCTFVKAGVEVARLARRVTRAADGSLTVADTPHKAPGGDLQDGGYAEATYFPTDWATVPTQVLTVHYTYDDGTFTSAVAETVIASKAGAEGNQGTQGNQGNLGNQGNQGNQGNLGNQGTQGNQGNQGTPVTLYYIKPTNGTAIQNHTGSLTVEAHKIEGGVDSILSSGTIKLHEDTTELGTGYSATLTEAEISGAIVVTLKDGPSGTPLDTITLVDVADGTPPTSWTANMSSGMEMISPSHFRKASGGAYAEQVYSSEGYTTNVYLSASLEAVGVTGLPFIGLDENPTQDANYTNIDYAWHCGNSGNTWYVYESGSLIDAYGGTPTANDVVSILYDGEYIRYLFNGAEVRKVARAVGNKLYLDSSFSRDGNYGWDNIAYGPNPSGTNAVYGYITATNGLAWTRAADQSTWTPSASATDLVCTFVKGGTTIATRTWEVSRSANGILTGLTNGASGDSVTVTEINEGTQAFTVKFTHDNSGVSVSETVMTSMAGSQGNQGNQGSQGNTGNQGNQGGTGNQGNQGSQGNQGNQGNQGTLGLSVFYGAVYRRSDTQGTAPSNGTYNFADGTLTPPTGGTGGAWYVVPPVPDGKALWVTRATVTAPAGTTGTFGTWSTPARAISDGQTPSASPTPAVKEGIGYLLATWNAVANADPVWFEVHISTSTSFSGTEPGNGTWVASTPATSYAFKALADGTPLEYSTDYYIKVTEHDEDGSSTTPASYVGPYQMKLATSDDIDVGTINASAITADSMTGVSIDAATIAGSTIRTGDAPSPRVELDSTGLVVYDGSGAGPGNQGIRIVDIPTNNLDAAVFKTRLETPGGSIEGDMVLKDPGNIKVWATTSVTAPTVAPTVSPYWPSFLMSYSIGRKGSFWDTAGGTYGKIYTIGDESQPFIMSYNVTASGYPPTSSYDQRVQLATNYAGTGIVKAGSYLWTLEKNSSTGKWYIKSRNINTGYTTTGWQVEVTSLIPTQGFLPGLGYDGTYVCLLTRSSGGYVLVRKYSVSTNTLSYQSGQSYTTDTTHPNNAGGVSGLVTTGGYDWISYRSYYSSVIPYTVVPGTSGTAQSTKIFYSKDGATPSGGLCWDGTRFWTTALDYYMHQHSTVEYGSTDTPYFAYTWYKDAATLLTRDANDYETTGSPIGSGGTWPNRSFISVTTPGIPGAANAIALFGKIATSTPTLASLIAQPASSEGIQAVGETGAIFETLSTDTNDEYADLNGARQEFPEDYNFALNSDGTGRWDHLVPVGTIQMYAGSSLPDGWLWCDGTTFSQTSYPDLATVVGDTYGTHSGDNYYKPDLLGRFPLGAGGGTPNKSLGTGHDAATTHTHDSHTQNTNTSAGGAADRLSAPVTHSSYESPYLAINFIIKHD